MNNLFVLLLYYLCFQHCTDQNLTIHEKNKKINRVSLFDNKKKKQLKKIALLKRRIRGSTRLQKKLQRMKKFSSLRRLSGPIQNKNININEVAPLQNKLVDLIVKKEGTHQNFFDELKEKSNINQPVLPSNPQETIVMGSTSLAPSKLSENKDEKNNNTNLLSIKNENLNKNKALLEAFIHAAAYKLNYFSWLSILSHAGLLAYRNNFKLYPEIEVFAKVVRELVAKEKDFKISLYTQLGSFVHPLSYKSRIIEYTMKFLSENMKQLQGTITTKTAYLTDLSNVVIAARDILKGRNQAKMKEFYKINLEQKVLALEKIKEIDFFSQTFLEDDYLLYTISFSKRLNSLSTHIRKQFFEKLAKKYFFKKEERKEMSQANTALLNFLLTIFQEAIEYGSLLYDSLLALCDSKVKNEILQISENWTHKNIFSELEEKEQEKTALKLDQEGESWGKKIRDICPPSRLALWGCSLAAGMCLSNFFAKYTDHSNWLLSGVAKFVTVGKKKVLEGSAEATKGWWGSIKDVFSFNSIKESLRPKNVGITLIKTFVTGLMTKQVLKIPAIKKVEDQVETGLQKLDDFVLPKERLSDYFSPFEISFEFDIENLLVSMKNDYNFFVNNFGFLPTLSESFLKLIINSFKKDKNMLQNKVMNFAMQSMEWFSVKVYQSSS